ncbi:hypothetical protein ACOSP7_010250 [Xanthoceras sorbifolium]
MKRDGTKREAFLRMYNDFNGKPFKFEHCWEILKNHPKWCSVELTKQCGSKKKTVDGSFHDNLSSPTATIPGSFDTIDLDSPVNEDTNSNGVVRPQGRIKAAEEKKRRMADDKGVIDVLNNLHCTIERQIDF